MIGIIGGSGLGEALGGLGKGEAVQVDTPFGPPSAPIVVTTIEGVRVALLSRHGEGHAKNPSQVPYRANIYALKKLGVTHVMASTAVGSLREEIAPTHVVITDQVIDKTFLRANTFFDDLAVHVELASPFCQSVRGALLEASKGLSTTVHPKGTYVCMEGPAFSTRAESEMHRAFGAQLIGMTVMPEAKLAREAELCYANIALPTDYDCWKPHPDGLDQLELVKEILGNLKTASAHGIELFRRALPKVAALAQKPCSCQRALQMAIWSDKAKVPNETWTRLGAILGKYAP